MNDSVMDDMVYLIRCALGGVEPDERRVVAMNLDAVLALAQRHMLASACGMALKAVGISHSGFDEARGKAIRKVAAMDIERNALFSRFDSAGIWYVPLKGCVLKSMYPSFGMREMSDNDILIDALCANEVRSIMESMGFTTVEFESSIHDVYHKEPVCNFELHKKLFDVGYGHLFVDYYDDVEKHLIPDDGGMGRHFRDEDFYVYLLAHEYRHFANGGTGLRSILDTYIFLNKKGDLLDWSYVRAELSKLGLLEFERSNRNLAMHLFNGEELSESDEEMLTYIAESGAYGTIAHEVANGIKRCGVTGYLLNRAFPSYDEMLLKYPLLQHMPALLPVCWAARIGRALMCKRRAVFSKIGYALAKKKRRYVVR